MCLARCAASALFKIGNWRYALRRRNPLAASSMAALVQRSAMNASCQCFTLRQTRRIVPFMFSMMPVAGQGTAQVRGQAEAIDGEDFVAALQDTVAHAGCIVLQAAGQIADQTFGLLGIVQFPGLAQGFTDRSLQGFGQTLGDVAGLMHLAALDRGMATERPPACPGPDPGIALLSALAPSTMNRRETAGSRPRPIRLSSSAGTVAAFSVAPPRENSTPIARVPSNSTRWTSALVTTCRLVQSQLVQSQLVQSQLYLASRIPRSRQPAVEVPRAPGLKRRGRIPLRSTGRKAR